jgi:hypothetical protein
MAKIKSTHNPVKKKTLCSKGRHIWIFNIREQDEPFDWQPCFCGKKEWKDRDPK